MKLIDLLNKIANGEEAPKKIKINNVIYEYRSYYLFGKWNFNILNTEVEILEEEKKIPEKLSSFVGHTTNEIIDNIYEIKDKINEIIDCLKSKGDE